MNKTLAAVLSIAGPIALLYSATPPSPPSAYHPMAIADGNPPPPPRPPPLPPFTKCESLSMLTADGNPQPPPLPPTKASLSSKLENGEEGIGLKG
jgi:hypothetical protein